MSEFLQTRGGLISQVRTQFKELNADSSLTDRQIWSVIDKHARWLISREAKNLQLMSYDTIFQTFKCAEVEDAPAIDDCCGVRSKCLVKRTKDKLPDMYEGEDGVLIKTVFTIDGSKEFVPIKIQEYMRKLENPDSRFDRSLYVYFNNGYLYFPKVNTIDKSIVNQTHLRKVMIKAMFIDEVVNPCDKDSPPCISAFDMKIRFPKKLEGEIMSHVFQEFGIYKQVPNDAQIDKNENRKN